MAKAKLNADGYLTRMIAEGMVAQEHLKASAAARDPGFFRASNTRECPRALYYGRIGQLPSNEFEPDVIEKMAKGDLLHDRIRGVLIPRFTPFRVAYHQPEIALRGSFSVETADSPITVAFEGHCDGLLVDMMGRTKSVDWVGNDWQLETLPPAFKPLALLEVKSTSFRGYKAVETNRMNPEHYSGSYKRQGFRYIALWNLMFPKNPIDRLCVLMYNVNGDPDPVTGLPMKDYWFAFDQEVFNDDLQTLALVERDVRNGKTSPQGYKSPQDWHCQGCLWKDLCWGKRSRKPRNAAPGRPEESRATRADRRKSAKQSMERRSQNREASLTKLLGEIVPIVTPNKGRGHKKRPTARQTARRKVVGTNRKAGR